MDLNGIVSASESYSAVKESMTASYESTKITITASKEAKTSAKETVAATYEKGSGVKDLAGKIDYATIDKLKAEAEERTASLRNLVEKMMLKQSGASVSADNGLAAMYRSLTVDPEVSAQAQKDIAEDGYWGIEQTSDRILSFAKALAGDDADTANSMLDAIKKGFELAGKEWGEELPDLSQKTMETTLNKVNNWISSLDSGTVDDGTSHITITYSEEKSSFSSSIYIETNE